MMKSKTAFDTSKIKIRPDEDYKPGQESFSVAAKKKIPFEIFRKAETPFMILGIGLLAFILIYVLFSTMSGGIINGNSSVKDLEERIALLEEKLQYINASGSLTDQGQAVEKYMNRFDRFEATVSLKMDVMEKKFADLWNEKQKKELVNTAEFSKPVIKKETPALTVKKKEKNNPTPKSMPVYHRIKKGETFYSISRKYNLTVDALRAINNLDKGSTLYPGQKLLVKK